MATDMTGVKARATGGSYRQAGTTKVGHVQRGPPKALEMMMAPPSESYPSMRPRIKRAAPSIPTKFENTLHVGQRERDAFGTRTQRFHHFMTDIPGPGNYHKGASMVRDESVCGSVSHLGYSVGFVSKTKRFSDKDEIQSRLDPGPGDYESKAVLSKKKTFTTARYSAGMAPPRRFRDDPTLDDNRIPGPGSYDDRSKTAPAAVREKARAHSTFTSKSLRRSFLDTHSVAPAPGAYNVGSSMKINSYSKKKLSAVFAQTEPRLHNIYPAAENGHPGPGDYDPRAKQPGGPRGGRQLSHMFSNTNHDRWGVPYKKKSLQTDVPGPGWYTPPVVKKNKKKRATSSMFVSKSRRGADEILLPPKTSVKPPGPAYYKPLSTTKKSFMYNPSGAFV